MSVELHATFSLSADALAIAKETARQLEMGTAIYKADILDLSQEQLAAQTSVTSRAKLVEGADGFAGKRIGRGEAVHSDH